MVMVVILCAGCHKEEPVELYGEYDLPEQEEPEVEESAKTIDDYFDFDSMIDYQISTKIAEQIDPKAFDQALVAFLKEEEILPDVEARDMLVVEDDGYITYGLKDKSVEFNLVLLNDDETVITCVKDKDGNYSFNTLF